jgi:hypothetical protein
MKFIFTVFNKQEGSSHSYTSIEVIKIASTFEEAIKQLDESHPHHCVAQHLKGLYSIEHGEEV